jgi:osmoprotectant transport system substrate-binding protein
MRDWGFRAILSGVLGLSLMASACGSSGGGSPSSGSSGKPIASQMILGGPPECPTRPFCEKGLMDKYGLTFKDFKPLDAGGPLTKAALDRGDIQIGLLFSSDGSIAAKGYVVLNDDKHLQNADNVVPVGRSAALKSDAQTLLNQIDSKLNTSDLAGMNKSADIDKQDPAQIASDYLKKIGVATSGGGSGKGKITVAGFNFSESSILAQIYGQALKGIGYDVSYKLNLGNREVVEPALEKGDIDLYPGYAATELEFINKAKGEATPDPAGTVKLLNGYLQAKGLIALDPSAAQDQNAFAVTKETANKWHLVNLSDLAKNG